MCLAIPALVVSLDEITAMATVDIGGVRKEVSTQLVEDLCIGDYVLIHVGFALQKLDEDEAAQTLKLFAELQSMDNDQ
ncbi:MAG: HypC/HybG/HupF family hydrogenase formation chaperone [Zetaproteobacteria bacterium]|nr:HypC/HybG/HupF family hydrogenase formation chaperone [Zetaproteobacteria bacterium]